MIYFIADTHFDDDAILRYENRPFTTVEQMNESIVRQWNHTVGNNDTVYVLGDIGAESRLKDLLPKLNGTKYLIKGNHDTLDNQAYRNAGFTEVYDHPIILNNFWILSHEPQYTNSNMPYANIFGHVHSSALYKTASSQGFCVSVERINYTPIGFTTIQSAIEHHQKGNNYDDEQLSHH